MFIKSIVYMWNFCILWA